MRVEDEKKKPHVVRMSASSRKLGTQAHLFVWAAQWATTQVDGLQLCKHGGSSDVQVIGSQAYVTAPYPTNQPPLSYQGLE